ncbi:MAG: hypothetical protein EP338_02360 [Bacteroidetes bacterium]|nr:MAG: hypothetical protein EP338_02360 [Bacteroidota bacterium]
MGKARKALLGKIALLVNILIGAVIAVDFWWNRAAQDSQLSISVLVLCSAYITIEFLRKSFLTPSRWWNTLYYLGLFAVLLPLLFKDVSWEEERLLMSRLGVFFLIIPPLLSLWAAIKDKEE